MDGRKGMTIISVAGTAYPVKDSITEFLSDIEYEEGSAANK